MDSTVHRWPGREETYRRRFGIALILSALFHTFLLLGLPAPDRWNRIWTAPHVGYAGPELYLGELNPQDFPIAEQEALASLRRQAGAMVEETVDLEPRSEEKDRILERLASGMEGQDATVNPVLELSESFALRSTSAPTSRSNEFTILQMVRPQYPKIAIAAGIEGLVKVQAWVDQEGRVVRVEVLESEVDSTCEIETLRAMRQWKFRPYRIGGRTVDFSVIVPFRFRLE